MNQAATDQASPDHTATAPHGLETVMRRALVLAALGPAHGPNPRVGCVLLDPDGRTVAEGYHRGAGTPHAEAAALTDARSRGIDPRGTTAVVTLEPCAHHGRTGPCADALIEAGVAAVHIFAANPAASCRVFRHCNTEPER